MHCKLFFDESSKHACVISLSLSHLTCTLVSSFLFIFPLGLQKTVAVAWFLLLSFFAQHNHLQIILKIIKLKTRRVETVNAIFTTKLFLFSSCYPSMHSVFKKIFISWIWLLNLIIHPTDRERLRRTRENVCSWKFHRHVVQTGVSAKNAFHVRGLKGDSLAQTFAFCVFSDGNSRQDMGLS